MDSCVSFDSLSADGVNIFEIKRLTNMKVGRIKVKTDWSLALSARSLGT